MADKVILSWSGGKDSAMALGRLLTHGGYQVCGLFTVYNNDTGRVNLHGTPIELIRLQAESLELPLHEIPLATAAPNAVYEAAHIGLFDKLKAEDIYTIAYGDIFVQEIRTYRDALAERAGMKFSYPLWKAESAQLADEFLKRNFKAVITAIDAEKMPGNALGRLYDDSFIKDLPENIDICGENGEFHTFVFDGPFFNRAVNFALGEKYEEDYRPAVDMQMKYVAIIPGSGQEQEF